MKNTVTTRPRDDNSGEKRFYVLLAGLARMCGTTLQKEIVAIYDRTLAPLGWDLVNRTVEEMIANRSSSDRFPSPADIKRAIEGEPLDRRDEALMITERILESIKRDGFYNQKRAKQRIGPLGWRVVQALGGYPRLTEMKNSELGYFRRNCIEVATSKLKTAAPDERRQLHEAPPEEKTFALGQASSDT